MEGLENSKNPHYSEGTGPNEWYDGGKDGIAQTSDGSGKYVHDTAKTIDGTDVLNSHTSKSDYLWILIIQRKKRWTEQEAQISQNNTG